VRVLAASRVGKILPGCGLVQMPNAAGEMRNCISPGPYPYTYSGWVDLPGAYTPAIVPFPVSGLTDLLGYSKHVVFENGYKAVDPRQIFGFRPCFCCGSRNYFCSLAPIVLRNH
jgi:hypothetical protein